MQWGVKIPLRDGVHLQATLYLPKDAAAPAPAIFTLTPYVAQRFHDEARYFAAQGYPFLSVDVRGRGGSQGVFRPLINEARDAFDVVEWLARQPYCNGKVTMWGGSYGGYVQWAAAQEFPPHLATIVPAASPCIGVDIPIRNNLTGPYWVQWLTLVSGHTSQDHIFSDWRFWAAQFKKAFESGVAFKMLDGFLGNASAIFQEWMAHPHQDDYWDGYNPTAEHYSRISIPVLTITGSYDGDQPGALEHYRRHLKNNSAAEHYLVIGPWDHAGTRSPQAEFCGLKFGSASLVDLPKLHVEWYAWTMQGGLKPQFLQNKVAYYVMGAEHWRYADSLESITALSAPFYLQSQGDATDVFQSGWLAIDPPGESPPDHYVYDPRDLSFAELESTIDSGSCVDQRMMHASIGKQLVYHSPPFEQDREISGFFKLTAWLAIDQPDTDFRVTVYEIGLDGGSIQLTTDSMRARYRQSLREEKLIATHEPLRYDFERFMFVSKQIKKNHRLRLVIGPVNSIYSQKNYNSGGAAAAETITDARAVTVRLFHNAAHASALHVPYGHPEG